MATDEPEIEVLYVQAKPKRLKGLALAWDWHEDLRPAWGSPSLQNLSPPGWRLGAVYVSNAQLAHSDGRVLPEGTPFVVTELTEGKLYAHADGADGLDSDFLGGDYLQLTCLDPETREPMQLGFWHGVQDCVKDQLDEVTNPLMILALAPGLPF